MQFAAIPSRQIRAVFTESVIRVYQAYSDEIADTALSKGTFISPPFNMNRMTWIKPSFLWMMCRAGWGLKDARQKRILAIDMRREGFEWAITHSRLTTHGEGKRSDDEPTPNCPVLVQWDPERDLFCNRQSYRSIQIGLRSSALELFVTEWIQSITEITNQAQELRSRLATGDVLGAQSMLPAEKPFPFPHTLMKHPGMD